MANMDGVSKVWDLASQTAVLTLVPEPDEQPAKAIAFNRDGSLLATGGDEGIVKVWDASTGKMLFSLPLGGIIHSVAFDPNADLSGGRERGWQCESLGRVDRGAGREPAAPIRYVRYCLPGQQQVCHGAARMARPGCGTQPQASPSSPWPVQTAP